jgi:hypothetical protein
VFSFLCIFSVGFLVPFLSKFNNSLYSINFCYQYYHFLQIQPLPTDFPYVIFFHTKLLSFLQSQNFYLFWQQCGRLVGGVRPDSQRPVRRNSNVSGSRRWWPGQEVSCTSKSDSRVIWKVELARLEGSEREVRWPSPRWVTSLPMKGNTAGNR